MYVYSSLLKAVAFDTACRFMVVQVCCGVWLLNSLVKFQYLIFLSTLLINDATNSLLIREICEALSAHLCLMRGLVHASSNVNCPEIILLVL